MKVWAVLLVVFSLLGVVSADSGQNTLAFVCELDGGVLVDGGEIMNQMIRFVRRTPNVVEGVTTFYSLCYPDDLDPGDIQLGPEAVVVTFSRLVDIPTIVRVDSDRKLMERIMSFGWMFDGSPLGSYPDTLYVPCGAVFERRWARIHELLCSHKGAHVAVVLPYRDKPGVERYRSMQTVSAIYLALRTDRMGMELLLDLLKNTPTSRIGDFDLDSGTYRMAWVGIQDIDQKVDSGVVSKTARVMVNDNFRGLTPFEVCGGVSYEVIAPEDLVCDLKQGSGSSYSGDQIAECVQNVGELLGYSPDEVIGVFSSERSPPGMGKIAYGFVGVLNVDSLSKSEGYYKDPSFDAVTGKGMGELLAHETAHLFGFCDEYSLTGYNQEFTTMGTCINDFPREYRVGPPPFVVSSDKLGSLEGDETCYNVGPDACVGGFCCGRLIEDGENGRIISFMGGGSAIHPDMKYGVHPAQMEKWKGLLGELGYVCE